MLKSTIKYGLLFFVALLSARTVLAQQKITEGILTISYAVDSFRVRKPTVYEDVKIYFKDDCLRVQSSYALFNKPNEISMIYQLGRPNILFLAEISGLKLAINSSEDKYKPMVEMSYNIKRQKTRPDLPSALLIDFKPTGQKEQVSGYTCEKYKADMPNGENISIWTTEEVMLPFNLLNYEIGSLGELLMGKKLKGTLLRLQYGNKLDATLKLDTQKIAAISMVAPEGYKLFDLNQVMAGAAAEQKNK